MEQQESLLWLRFIGDDLNIKSLPIYELGTVLIAFQQIVNKAYLFEVWERGQFSQWERSGSGVQWERGQFSHCNIQ